MTIKRESIFPSNMYYTHSNMFTIYKIYIQEAGTSPVIRRAARISQPSRLLGDLHLSQLMLREFRELALGRWCCIQKILGPGSRNDPLQLLHPAGRWLKFIDGSEKDKLEGMNAATLMDLNRTS